MAESCLKLDSGWFARTVPREPLHLLWEITDSCNLCCLHCEGFSGKKNPQELSSQEAMELCEQIVQMKWKRVSITGGEPLLRKDWADITARLTQGGCLVALITNGELFSKETAEIAKSIKVATVAVSLDGLETTHNRIRLRRASSIEDKSSPFQNALLALERAKLAGIKTAAITQVNLWNINQLQSMHELLVERDVFGWQIQVGTPLGRMRQIKEPYLLPVSELPRLEELCASFISYREQHNCGPMIAVMHDIGYYGKHEAIIRGGNSSRRDYFMGCLGGWIALCITSDGMVKPCGILPRNFSVGSIRQDSLADIWEDKDRFAYQSCWDEKKLEGYCRECQYRCICRAGCTAMAYALTGSIYNNPYCIYAQAMSSKTK